MSVLVTALHAAQACLSAYSGLLSYTSIVKLQQYEDKSEKAAQYSNTAEHQLHKTRTTQASGALATICSLAASVALAGSPSTLTWRTAVLTSAVNMAATTLAYRHVSNFWTSKAKVPFVQDFNDAINTSNQMLTALAALAVSWGLSCFVYGFQLVATAS